MSVADRMHQFHGLMSATEAAGYKVFSSEVNLLAPSPTCMEYGLKRSATCPLSERNQPREHLPQPKGVSSHEQEQEERVQLIAYGLVDSLHDTWEGGFTEAKPEEQVRWQVAIDETMRFASRWRAYLIANTPATANAPSQSMDRETLSALASAGIAPEALPPMNPSALCTIVNVPDWAYDLAENLRTTLQADNGGKNTNAKESLKQTERTLISYFFVRLAWVFRRSCTNFGAIVLTGLTPQRVLFRSQAVGSGPFLTKLLSHGGLKHVHNIYAERAFPLQDLLNEETRDLLATNGTFETHADLDLWHWLMGGLAAPTHGYELAAAHNVTAMRLVAGVVRRVLNPLGDAPRGNLLVHCAGGVHRTGIVVAILRRFVNRGEPLEVTLDDFRRHVGGDAASTFTSPNGYEAQKMLFFERFISVFDLRLLL